MADGAADLKISQMLLTTAQTKIIPNSSKRGRNALRRLANTLP